ncbi:hypothetical protein E1A91_D04G055000v1 [Gossypium mustelinum]|uniref:Uncharacterized protein n=3 Tax=Gossypium TaxID=3633 RepID=A0A5D2VAJ4_GOSMU|nr:hypothetical protein E1A91_D04G055000v1 [Gossypium mustelinum]TYI86292.1 hypothetical protein E1A91_D04G055000v1 [Gossypium mustelinum]TYI86293.1 hypothetical protein E1A91_D04G055000v1 [Gossypium mustelinum]
MTRNCMWRMVHLQTLSSQINLGLFLNHWWLFILPRFWKVWFIYMNRVLSIGISRVQIF